MLRIVFMGSDAIAVPMLDALAADPRATLAGVFTQPDRPAGRGQKTVFGPIRKWAEDRKVPVFQPDRLGVAELAQLRSLNPDLALVMAYGHILRPDFIGAPRLGTVNLHASLLPKLRGASPIQTAIATGEPTTGVALMRIVPELDAGPVAAIGTVPIGLLDTAIEVEARLAVACAPLVVGHLTALGSGELKFAEQDRARATFCRRLEKADGQLDFSVPAATLAARINGLYPWPGCVIPLAGQSVKLGLADVAPDRSDAPAAPGAVFGVDAEGLLVATGRGVLRLRRLQRPGGRMLSAADFLRGFPIADGTIVGSAPMAPLVATEPFPRRRP
ncbi:MAG TPA: methionyl-tRNA formyltransferase [Candidatus Didemnitutus sp.]|jgi:methionyl-tRNA formyltransferase